MDDTHNARVKYAHKPLTDECQTQQLQASGTFFRTTAQFSPAIEMPTERLSRAAVAQSVQGAAVAVSDESLVPVTSALLGCSSRAALHPVERGSSRELSKRGRALVAVRSGGDAGARWRPDDASRRPRGAVGRERRSIAAGTIDQE